MGVDDIKIDLNGGNPSDQSRCSDARDAADRDQGTGSPEVRDVPTAQLLPCPFCGMVPMGGIHPEYNSYWIGCINRACPMGDVGGFFKDYPEASTAWNTRARQATPND